ncbi:VOC family protein [Falsibacillus albus]|uniref:VOC family protein n=1 Tax=Falsibacillus albus TaxID=2478915 RepID=A0A3L7JUU2_9BACI|nr:VOC family protein [Falsibacillus albus]RLQ94065.1 VOC family protein [Falsibacillus albus]
MNQTTGRINKIGQISIPVQDLKTAVPFYSQTLGLPLLFETDGMAFLECDGVRLLLNIPENEQFDHPSSIVYFHVNDIDEAYRDMKDQGVAFIDEPHLIAKMGSTETWMVFFTDPEGNIHAFMSEKES